MNIMLQDFTVALFNDSKDYKKALQTYFTRHTRALFNLIGLAATKCQVTVTAVVGFK